MSDATGGAHYRVAVLPGDGIGQEVMPPALRIVEQAAAVEAVHFTWTTFDWGCEWMLEHGSMMPKDALDTLAGFDAIFLGAVGALGVPDHESLWGMLIPIRRRFHQYVNLRPMRLLRGVLSPLRGEVAQMDLVVVRENSEGEYSQVGGG